MHLLSFDLITLHPARKPESKSSPDQRSLLILTLCHFNDFLDLVQLTPVVVLKAFTHLQIVEPKREASDAVLERSLTQLHNLDPLVNIR